MKIATNGKVLDSSQNSIQKIPLTKPYLVGKEEIYVSEVIHSGNTGGNGWFTQQCQAFFEARYQIPKCLLTTSCTTALEMAALLLNIQPGDEVIIPAYNFPSAANAFLLRGAQIRFVPSRTDHPGMDESLLEQYLSSKTKAIVVMHYAGVATDMEPVLSVARKNAIPVVEDAAHGLEGRYKDRYLGTWGDLAAFSFHESKNLTAGEGGMLAINNPIYQERAEEIWQMGTNRAAYQRGDVKHYSWNGVGSSCLPSELNAAYLWGQLEGLETIQQKRHELWDTYYRELRGLESPLLGLPKVPDYAAHAAHNFYLVLGSKKLRDALMQELRTQGVAAAPHFRDIEKDYVRQQGAVAMQSASSESFANRLLRLPLYPGLKDIDQQAIIEAVSTWMRRLETKLL